MMNGEPARDRLGHARHDRLARGHAERSALEREIVHRDDDGQRLELAGGDDDRIQRAGLGAMLLQAVGVALDVAELQRIGGRLGNRQFLELAAVEQRGEPRLGAIDM